MEKRKWKQLSRRREAMIESFLRWALIGGQVLYWRFLKYETEIFSEQSKADVSGEDGARVQDVPVIWRTRYALI
jgi:hypothetical protein